MSRAEVGDLIVYSSKGYTMNFGIVYGFSGDFPMVHGKITRYKNGAWVSCMGKKMASVNYLVLRTADGQATDDRIAEAYDWFWEFRKNEVE